MGRRKWTEEEKAAAKEKMKNKYEEAVTKENEKFDNKKPITDQLWEWLGIK